MKYFVIITRWSDEKKAQVREIAGSFDRYFNAALFRDAYNNHFHANAVIVEQSELLN